MRTLLAIGAAASAWGCEPTVERALARDGDADRGSIVFAEHCASCHGDDGLGGEGPDLRGDDDTEEELAEKIIWGWGAMEGLRDVLSSRQIADVIAYVKADIQ